ncbi:sulfotransferase family 2 domain-containing protein [Mangrovimonas sp. YM274]|uniref:sulfotransferase family 2 domain-containing protein n=1 Tax=Mangrovimonas sp. YM274 TaxID=3070660 RepID=UPI0027DE5487|nr:sulfotransferase family 2 domain-containing protein [Mangrovimonas sp. YM274]WMI68460.1 sulfotransferase family 2 domain-containing protein [Mangrovimonas sp. YM274]
MISHKHKCIFIHIPKTAGSSVNYHLNGGLKLDWKIPNYEFLYGWCPKRRIHLQHATAKQMLEFGLVTEDQWKDYFKFTFVRNPWDRAYSDYLWVKQDVKIKGSFEDFLLKQNNFEGVLRDNSDKIYRGDHLMPQTDFFDFKENESYTLDMVGRFENFKMDFDKIKSILKINSNKEYFEKRNNKKLSYYDFYSRSQIKLVRSIYGKDIELLNYKYPCQIEIIKNKLVKKFK